MDHTTVLPPRCSVQFLIRAESVLREHPSVCPSSDGSCWIAPRHLTAQINARLTLRSNSSEPTGSLLRMLLQHDVEDVASHSVYIHLGLDLCPSVSLVSDIKSLVNHLLARAALSSIFDAAAATGPLPHQLIHSQPRTTKHWRHSICSAGDSVGRQS